MLFLRLILSCLILPYFLCPPQVFAQTRIEGKQREMLYQKVLSMAQKKVAIVNSKLPQGNVLLVQTEKNNAVKDELNERVKSLESADNAAVANFKKELLKLNEQELSQMKNELMGYVNAMTDAEISALGRFIAEGQGYEDAALEFTSAFTMREKQKSVRNALMRDLSFLRSIYNKKIGLSSKEDLKRDLKRNILMFEKGQDKSKIGDILKISLIALAGVALITWGISSAVYGARLNRVRNERETKLSELRKSLESQYQAYKEVLTQEELKYLEKAGYVRTVCGNFQQPDSILCNRYNYKLFTGTKYCTVYCYKNPTTGLETLHEPAVCTSPFIPTDCYDPQEYWNAYYRGEDDGYDDGYYDGEEDGSYDGASDGAYWGDLAGYGDGYDVGYSDGYYDGYDSGAASASKSAKTFIPFQKSEAYLKGFRDGYEQYQILFLNN